MKRLYLLLCLIIGTICAVQAYDYKPLVEDGKVWHMVVTDGGTASSYEFEYIIKGDTMIAGSQYCKLYVHNRQNDGMTQYQFAVGERDGVVSFVAEGESDAQVLYDFSAQPGDTITITDADGQRSMYVEGQRVADMYGTDRRIVMVNGCAGGDQHEFGSGCWIEGIGSELGQLRRGMFYDATGNTSLSWCELDSDTLFEFQTFRAAMEGLDLYEYSSGGDTLLRYNGRWTNYVFDHMLNARSYDIVVPDGVAVVGEGFLGYSHMPNGYMVELPSTTKEIEAGAFGHVAISASLPMSKPGYACRFVCHAAVPPVVGDEALPHGGVLYVPEASLDAYRADAAWAAAFDTIVAIGQDDVEAMATTRMQPDAVHAATPFTMDGRAATSARGVVIRNGRKVVVRQ